MRRLFDPWPVFFKREWNRNWPFLVGFAVTGTIITKMSLGLTGRRRPRTRSSFRGTSKISRYNSAMPAKCVVLHLPFGIGH
ncbi:ATP synthase small subunit 6, mitochondrial [Linum grandiflorum]